MDKDFAPELSLFGASVVETKGSTFLCGGMGADQAIDGQAIYCVTSSEAQFDVVKIKQHRSDAASKPFMIGSSVMHHGGSIIVTGGGATCFSMGTFWDTNVYQAAVPTSLTADRTAVGKDYKPTEVKFISSHRVVSSTSAQKGDPIELGKPDAKVRISTIPRISLTSASEFKEVLRRGQPVVFENLQLGKCLGRWTAEYMTDRVGADEKVSILAQLICHSRSFLTDQPGGCARMQTRKRQNGFQREEFPIRYRGIWYHHGQSQKGRPIVLALTIK